jgi:hypothetical protein
MSCCLFSHSFSVPVWEEHYLSEIFLAVSSACRDCTPECVRRTLGTTNKYPESSQSSKTRPFQTLPESRRARLGHNLEMVRFELASCAQYYCFHYRASFLVLCLVCPNPSTPATFGKQACFRNITVCRQAVLNRFVVVSSSKASTTIGYNSTSRDGKNQKE